MTPLNETKMLPGPRSVDSNKTKTWLQGFSSPGFKLHATLSATFLADILFIDKREKNLFQVVEFSYRLEYQI